VVVLTHPKCGTTLLQHMVSLLKHGGEEASVHMMEAIPWLEKARAPTETESQRGRERGRETRRTLPVKVVAAHPR
jgi:hypothetical protein